MRSTPRSLRPPICLVFGSVRLLALTANQLLLNPLRSESEAFRFLLYVAGVVVVVVVVVLIVRALG